MYLKTENSTPTFIEAINALIDNVMVNVHTSIPAIVQSYNPTKKTVDVIPAIKKIAITGEAIELPVLSDIPVAYYQTNKFLFSFPLEKGDTVQLIFNERSIDKWRKSGEIETPDDYRKFDLSDAVAYPTLKINDSGYEANANNVLLKYQNTEIQLSDGKLKLQGQSDELIDLCQQLATACSQILTNTQIGPQAPINASTFSSIATKLGNIKL